MYIYKYVCVYINVYIHIYDPSASLGRMQESQSMFAGEVGGWAIIPKPIHPLVEGSQP